jgi:hypothetical protein
MPKVTKRKKPGPPPTGRTPILGVRLDPDIRSKIDEFATRKGYETLSDAVRHLLERALACPNITA